MTTSAPSHDQRVSEQDIRRLVHAFYARIQVHETLGPIFNERLAGRWDAHLEKMCDFWSSILRATGRYLGNPMQTHAVLIGVTTEHFDQWMELFEEVASDVLEEWQARDVVGRAGRMRVALERFRAQAQVQPEQDNND